MKTHIERWQRTEDVARKQTSTESTRQMYFDSHDWEASELMDGWLVACVNACLLAWFVCVFDFVHGLLGYLLGSTTAETPANKSYKQKLNASTAQTVTNLQAKHANHEPV